jgi:hypothetical protein
MTTTSDAPVMNDGLASGELKSQLALIAYRL